MKITRYALALPVLYALYYLIPLEFRALWQPDEVRYAEISREMLLSGNWIVPHFLDLRYFEKPVAGYWINNLSQWLLGGNNFSVRFGSVFSITLSALLVYWLALRLWRQRATALLAAVMFLTCLLVYAIGTYAVLDPMITLWLVAAMCSFWLAAEADKRWHRAGGWLLLGLACGMGFMTKGFLALAVPVVAIVPWMIAQRRFRELLLYGPLALLSCALISAPWALSIARQEPDFWHYFFWVEHIQRFAEQDAQHKAPFWYYIPVLIAGTVPWLGLLPGALRRGWNGPESAKSRYLLSWVVMPLLFFSIAKGKLPTYILPCFAPLALLLAHHARHLALNGGRGLKANAVINIAFGTLLALVVLLVLAPWGWAHHPVYDRDEGGKVLLAASAFLFWALIGVVTLVSGACRWRLAALCPLGLALVLGAVLPDKVINSKQPQSFLTAIGPDLPDSRWLLANNTGMASALAWQLKRSDVRLLGEPGELSYGVSYADGADRRVTNQKFADWLSVHRRQGSVSLVMKLTDEQRPDDPTLPPPDRVYQQGRMLWYLYEQRP
ncbi:MULTISPECIES: lipid IV(A) 4-amino-4-deoxy-L-arabinosyltransferase [unclassified Erwinia]|uniref:lipid IV(A) 4-amino-4-deoxy-L-arabinosyltransferase n=1 Tax=unclassified Erwinia TaxID=2622719 RepID=UPI0006F7AE7A|nr:MULTISPECIES: lipid IV(A) 4-amino-4-deoxy-L-arabinosyltransferase [unclassified Erwinia]KQN54313.1 4-amino-4-deoxy-L-arabinose transferase [Erwinia sp. Leaf53]PLV54451.1 4-amino-4-deoxy-L-arabinose transferase [Erwinia sp. B116]